MADIFAILGQAAAPRNSLSSSSIEDLEKHLRGLLETKVSPDKAERISFNFEISSVAKFTVSISQSENDVLEGLGGIDPVLGGAGPPAAPGTPNGAQVECAIAAIDTVMNQPQGSPTLQRIVAKHIIGSVGACDGSTWAVREMSRGAQGWSFTYICKDSMQSWRRQNAKSMQNVVVGDYTEKERDPVSTSRPAFDCSGSVVISFMRSSRNITVKYKHTPFHQTVAELYDRFAPPPPPIPPPVATATPKPAKSSRKRDARNGDGEGNTRKKPRKKSGVGAGADGQDTGSTDQPDGTPQPKRKRQYKKKASDAAAGEAGQQGGSAQNGEDGAVYLGSVVNVDAAEAARRREKARELLSNSGVDPETLSTDQFNIFSNQSPALQSESLAMLVEYGAERLRIVHPNKDDSAENTTGSQTAPASTAEASAGAGVQAGTGTPTSSAKGQRVTRGSCSNCRGQKAVKCGREKPACQNCVDAGIDCTYPLQQSRPRKSKADANGAGEVGEADETSMMDTQQDGDTTQISVADETLDTIKQPTTQDHLLPAQQEDHGRVSNLNGQDDVPDDASVDEQDQDVAQQSPVQTYHIPEPPQPEPEPNQEPVAAPPLMPSKSRGNRHSLPSGRQSRDSSEHHSVSLLQSPPPNWGTVNPNSLATSQSQAAQTTVPHAPAAPTPQMYPRGYQDTQDVASLSNAALRNTQSPQARATALQHQQQQRSPYQAQTQAAAASNQRTKSHQGHRGQSRTPVQDVTPLGPPLASAPHPHPPPRPASATPRQPTPVRAAASRNHFRDVPAASANRSPDSATYNAASSLSGLGNYGCGNFSSQSEGDQETRRIGYEPYPNHPVAGNQSYTSYDNFNRSSTKNVKMTTTSAQHNTAGYATSCAGSPSRWPSQGSGLTSTTSTPATTSYTHPSLPAQTSHSPYNLPNITQTTAGSNPYAQKPQAQAQQAYTTYNPQSESQSPSQHAAHQQQNMQRQRPRQQHQQQNWYGFGPDAGAGAAEGYPSGRGGYVGASYGQHGGINMPGHGGYGGDSDALIDLLGSVHHRS